MCEELDIDFMGMGVLPKWSRNDMSLMPKKRYKIMSKYMPSVGSEGLDMMLRTCTIQANFDFSSEEDMKKISCQPVNPTFSYSIVCEFSIYRRKINKISKL